MMQVIERVWPINFAAPTCPLRFIYTNPKFN